MHHRHRSDAHIPKEQSQCTVSSSDAPFHAPSWTARPSSQAVPYGAVVVSYHDRAMARDNKLGKVKIRCVKNAYSVISQCMCVRTPTLSPTGRTATLTHPWSIAECGKHGRLRTWETPSWMSGGVRRSFRWIRRPGERYSTTSRPRVLVRGSGHPAS